MEGAGTSKAVDLATIRELGDEPELLGYTYSLTFMLPSESLLADIMESVSALSATPPAPADDEEQAIIDLIRSVGHRLTTSQLLSEFEHRGQIKAESTIKLKLGRMVRAGLLTNRQDVRPPKGYGLPEWD